MQFGIFDQVDRSDRPLAQLGLNYVIGSFHFGNMQDQDARRSLRLFARKVTPAFQT